jgi:hypothetical protein
MHHPMHHLLLVLSLALLGSAIASSCKCTHQCFVMLANYDGAVEELGPPLLTGEPAHANAEAVSTELSHCCCVGNTDVTCI